VGNSRLPRPWRSRVGKLRVTEYQRFFFYGWMFQEALQRDTAERDAWLRQACHGDAGLKREGASLPANHQEATGLDQARGASGRQLHRDQRAEQFLQDLQAWRERLVQEFQKRCHGFKAGRHLAIQLRCRYRFRRSKSAAGWSGGIGLQ